MKDKIVTWQDKRIAAINRWSKSKGIDCSDINPYFNEYHDILNSQAKTKKQYKGKNMTIEEMDEFVKNSKPGDRIIYHKGFIAEELGHADSLTLKRFASHVRSLESRKKILLVQKKIKAGGVGSNAPIYHYIAERIKNDSRNYH